jgi:CDP-diacylglycerol---glycerol-3-phosphate 3-phosphatidyltransferase
MASIYDLKPAFQGRLRPLVVQLAARGGTANQVTISALLLSIVAGVLVALWPESALPLLLLPVALFVRMALNAIDGMLAREHNQKSRLGALLNEIGDVLSDAALYLPLATVPGVPSWPVILAVIFAATAELTGVLGPTIGASRRYDGPMGKSDRAVVFGALALWLGFGLPAGLWIDALLWLVVLLLLITIWNRARRALRDGSR